MIKKHYMITDNKMIKLGGQVLCFRTCLQDQNLFLTLSLKFL